MCPAGLGPHGRAVDGPFMRPTPSKYACRVHGLPPITKNPKRNTLWDDIATAVPPNLADWPSWWCTNIHLAFLRGQNPSIATDAVWRVRSPSEAHSTLCFCRHHTVGDSLEKRDRTYYSPSSVWRRTTMDPTHYIFIIALCRRASQTILASWPHFARIFVSSAQRTKWVEGRYRFC